MSRYTSKSVQSSVFDAIQTFYDGAEALAAEAREVVDSTPEGLQGSSRFETFNDTADMLEGFIGWNGLEETSDEVLNVPCEYVVQMYGGKRAGSESRAVRLANACAAGNAAVAKMREWCEQERKKLEEGAPNPENPNPEDLKERTLALGFEVQDERKGLIDMAEEMYERIEQDVADAEGCEFPGMYG
jgi:hypothetical protein